MSVINYGFVASKLQQANVQSRFVIQEIGIFSVKFVYTLRAWNETWIKTKILQATCGLINGGRRSTFWLAERTGSRMKNSLYSCLVTSGPPICAHATSPLCLWPQTTEETIWGTSVVATAATATAPTTPPLQPPLLTATTSLSPSHPLPQPPPPPPPTPPPLHRILAYNHYEFQCWET